MAESGLVATSTKYSTLELIKHDIDTERDRARFASDSDRHFDDPQVATMHDSEVFYSDTPPEALKRISDILPEVSNNIEYKSRKARDDSADSSSRSLSPRMTIIVTAIIAAVLVGIAVGVGVGVGLRKQRSRSGPTTVVMSTVTRTASGSPEPTHSSLLTNRSILDDTSVAALTFPNGEARLFFQDLSGVIRQASYNASLREWKADISDVVASDAKNHTPITVATTSTAYTEGNPTIFYILENNSLACRVFANDEWIGSTDSGYASFFGGLSNYIVAADSRHLSAASFSSYTMLFYESSKGGVASLNRSSQPQTGVWVWNDSSKELQDSLGEVDLRLNAPFTAIPAGNISHLAFFAGKYANGSYSADILQTVGIESHNRTQGLSTENFTAGFEPDSIQHSDILVLDLNLHLYGFWVNGSTLVPFTDTSTIFSSLPTLPKSSFPFTRLAGLSDANSSAVFIYHQLNASTFAEDQWDSTGGWISSAITISMA